MILCDIVNGYSLMQIYTKRGELPLPHLLKYDNKTVEGVSKQQVRQILLTIYN